MDEELIQALDALFEPDEAIWLDADSRELVDGHGDAARYVRVAFADYMRAVSAYLAVRPGGCDVNQYPL